MLKEIRKRHLIAQKLIDKDLKVDVKTIHLDRAELLKMLGEIKLRLDAFNHGNDFIEIKDILAKFDQ